MHLPLADALESKVRLALVPDGVYDRGARPSATAPRRTPSSPRWCAASPTKSCAARAVGVVTFSTAQQDYIERRLSDAIVKNRLEAAAYERDEPIFVKNLENVQGDERDVSPLFRLLRPRPRRPRRAQLRARSTSRAAGGGLNVAASRAREEMVVFSSMTAAMIDLNRTNSKGVAGLKAFLEFAEKGKTSLAIGAEELTAASAGPGRYIAAELAAYGYDCPRADLGVSDFKIDCAVLDPRGGGRFLLAVLCDGPAAARSCARDRCVLQVQTLL